MIETCNKSRDKALISLIYESAGRVGEIIACDISSFVDKGRYGLIKLEGKTGTRQIAISDSVFYMRKWINEHPLKDNPNAPMFISHDKKHQHKRIKFTGICGYNDVLFTWDLSTVYSFIFLWCLGNINGIGCFYYIIYFVRL